MTRTLYDKLVDAHKVCDLPDGDILVYMNDAQKPFSLSGEFYISLAEIPCNSKKPLGISILLKSCLIASAIFEMRL